MVGHKFCMSFLYILRSIRDKKLYIGVTDRTILSRLNEHNSGRVPSTKSRRPFELVYSEAFITFSEARKKEWWLKYTPAGGKMKKLLVSKAGG